MARELLEIELSPGMRAIVRKLHELRDLCDEHDVEIFCVVGQPLDEKHCCTTSVNSEPTAYLGELVAKAWNTAVEEEEQEEHGG